MDSMRVIAGKLRGRVLNAPPGYDTRPVTSKIKEALFNIWQMQIYDAQFLDLFAGSGSIGIEAMSRGAKNVVFVEQSKIAVGFIRKNLETCKLTDGFELYQDDVFRRIDSLKSRNRRFDLIYLDPPFTVDEIFIPVMDALSDGKLLNEEGSIAIRTPANKEMPENIGVLYKYKYKNYGISDIHFYAGNE